MKHLTPSAISQVKTLKPWTSTNFHGNRKKLGSLPVEAIKEIVEKKAMRQALKIQSQPKTNIQIVRELIPHSLNTKGTGYFKVLIEGNTSIYYASPEHGHKDYNKSRVFEKNEQTLKLMRLFNSIVGA